MFHFEDPQYFYLLIAVVLLAAIFLVSRHNRKSRLRKFGDKELVEQLMPNVSRVRPTVKFWLLAAALALVIVMLARPQKGTRISNEKRTGIETIITVDISNSMLATDIQPSRLRRAKMLIENLVDNFSNDKIGLIVFAGNAFVQLPITDDYVSAKMFLDGISPEMIQQQGTDIATAISMATNCFTPEKNIGKAIIVITDGEDHEGGATEAAEAARDAGMRVYVLGIGSTKGSPIPDGHNGYLKDNTGQVVMSALNENMCRDIAKAGGGAYIHVENNSRAQQLLDEELDKLEKGETKSTIYSDYDEQFQGFALVALLLIVLEVCILEIKNPLLANFRLFARNDRRQAMKSAIVMLLLSMTAGMAQAQQPDSPRQQPREKNNQAARRNIKKGNRDFKKNNLTEAETFYRKALEQNADNPQALYNLGTTLIAGQQDTTAIQYLENAAKTEENPLRQSMAYHNLGAILQGKKMYADAIEQYKMALRLNPNDDESRYNLQVCKKQQQKQEQNQDKNKNDQKDQQDKQDQQKQQQEQQKKEQDKQQQQQQQPQQQMSKENTEQLLNAAMQEEKRTQKRMQEHMEQPKRRQVEKNW